jgi:serine/threonine protein phosphatase PrpC
VEIDFMLVSTEGHNLMKKVCTNNQSIKQIAFNEGCTACVVLITDDSIYCANAGDSRAVIGTKTGDVVELSFDHKPENDIEKKRIVEAGGVVSMGRVDATLAVSRAIGDWEFKDENLLGKL